MTFKDKLVFKLNLLHAAVFLMQVRSHFDVLIPVEPRGRWHGWFARQKSILPSLAAANVGLLDTSCVF